MSESSPVTAENRMYLRSGRVAHRVPFNTWGPLDCALSRCGQQPDLFDTWYGTGGQDEYDKAERLRLCKHCAAKP